MATIQIRRHGTIRTDKRAAGQAIAAVILKHNRERTERGLDANDRPMPAYSSLYRMQLRAIGVDDDVDTRQSGMLMKSLRMKRVDVRGSQAVVTFGVDSSTSPRRPRPPPWVFAGDARQNAAALARWQRAPKRAEQSLPHDRLMAILQKGQRNTPARLVLGVSPSGRPAVLAELARARIFVSR